jgi:hypothetical protein
MKRSPRCLAWPVRGTRFCPLHTPERIEQRRRTDKELASQRKAAQARKEKLATLQPARDLLELLLALVDQELARPDVGAGLLIGSRR